MRRRAGDSGEGLTRQRPVRKGAIPSNGQGEIRADEAAFERGHDWARRSWQDQFDGGDHEDVGVEGRSGVSQLRFDRQCARGAGAGDHDRDRPCRVRDRQAALRPRRLSGACRLHQEHDHRGGPDGRGDSGGQRPGRADAANPGAHSAGPPGRSAQHRRLSEQGRHDGRSRAAGAGRAGGAGAAQHLQLPRRRDSGHPGQCLGGLGECEQGSQRAGVRADSGVDAGGG